MSPLGGRSWLHFGVILSLVAGLVVGLPPALAAAEPVDPSEKSVPVGVAGAARAADPSDSDGPGVTRVDRVVLPRSGSAEVATSGSPVVVGGLPVSVRAPAAVDDDVPSGSRVHGGLGSSLSRVSVAVADPQIAEAAGVRGVVLSVSPVGRSSAGGLDVEVDYSAFSQLYGANFGDRLRLVQLPACVLTTPSSERCRVQVELGSVNRAGKVSARVPLPSGAASTASFGDEAVPLAEPGGPVVLAATAGANSQGATFEATSLSQTYSWSAGSPSGSFSWSYPLQVPSSLGGPAPELALSYDSGSVDGKTLAANGQTSWVGEGWDLQTGYVERSYRQCHQDGATSSNVGDYCWFSSYNATLVMGGRSFKLVRDAASQVWKSDDDNGWKIEQRFGGSVGNGDNDDEHWVVTTLDGTQFWFGKHKRYAADTQVTNSVQLVGVWGNNSGEPCALSWCMQGYRWNLDYVVDARGNSMTLFYTKFKGRYGFNGNCCGTLEYDLSAVLDRIEYGTRAGSEASSAAPMRVVFTSAERCINSCVKPTDYLDTPWDLHCTSSSACPSVTSPVFFSPKRLSAVSTQVRTADGTAYRTVDRWEFTHTYPSNSDGTSPNLWLQSLTHRGYAADGTTSLAEPSITFGSTQLQNRVDHGADLGVVPYMHHRLKSITNGVGGQTTVTYAGQECPYRDYKPSPGYNPYRCFPQFHKPKDAPAGYGWFHKYVVANVTEADLTGANTPEESWSYDYKVDSSTDTSLWGHDFNETTQLDYRSWPLWRGYSDVTTTHGPAGGQQTVSKALYHRGMDGDSLASADNQSMAWEARRASLSIPVGVWGQTAAVGGRGGRCLDVSGGGTAAGTPIVLWDCHGGAAQVWRYTLQPGSYQLTLSNPASGRCLTPAGSSPGARLEIRDCGSGNNQKWRFTPDGGLINVGTGKCFDAAGWGLSNGTITQLYDCTGTWNQKVMPRNDGTLQATHARRCLDVYNGDSTNGTKIQTWTCSGHAAQSWLYWPSGSSLKNPHTNKCLDVAGSGTANGTLVQLYDCNNGVAQVWVPQSDGTLKNPNSGRCLDAGSQPAHGNQLMIWDCNGGLAQQWAHLIRDSVALQGKPREQFTFNGTSLLSSTMYAYSVSTTGTRAKPVTGGQDIKAYRARPTSVLGRTWVQATSSWRWTRTRTTFDSYGLPTQVNDEGDMNTSPDNRCIQYGYVRNTDKHLIDLVQWERTLTTCTETPADGDFLSASYHYYDNDTTGTATPSRGLVTRTNALKEVSGGVRTWVQASRTVYDTTYGRILESYDALDRKTTTSYSPSSALPVIQIAVNGPMGTGWTTTTTIEPGHGTPTKVTDINGKATTAQYDPLGRLTKVWLHNRPTTTVPDREFTYTLSNAPSWVRTRTLGPNGNQIDAFQIYDGRLRPRQAQTVTEAGKRMIADIRYDGRGLKSHESVVYSSSSAPTSSLASLDLATVPRQTRYDYDLAGRVVKVKLFNNNVEQLATTTVYEGDRTGVIPPAGGTVTQDLYDARGQVVEKRQYQSPTALTGAYNKTLYAYSRLGQLTKVTDPGNNIWTYEYDLLGRKWKTIDPDAGISTTAYDNAGQITSTVDARGQALFYDYDNLGRKLRQRDGSATGAVMASWTYDTVAKGQLASSTRHVGADQYISRVTSLDDGYRPLRTEVSIPNSTVNGGLAGTYAWEYTYKPNGAPATTKAPGVGGLPAETLTSTYSDTGFAKGTSGAWTGGGQTYVADTTYYYDGLLSTQLLGDTGKRVRAANTFDAATRRLTIAQIDTENQSTPGSWDDKYTTEYGYSKAGDITAIAGKTNGVRDQAECFTYDYLRRLTRAFTNSSWSCGTPTRAGADPYWREWTFDAIGNRLTQIDKDTTAGDTTWTYQVGSAGGVKPHQLKKVDATGPKAGTASRTFGYDVAGNAISATTPTGATQTLTWDKEGHLGTVTEAGNTTSYLYDTGGARLIARTPDKTILYLPDGTELAQPTAGGPVLGTRYYGVAVRDATGLKWTLTNHQNTNVVQIDSVTLGANRQRMMPYGENRTSQPADWMGSKGYVGGIRDNTGYTHLGAREYDPSLGRFISVDPIMDLTDPQQWHAYTYANGNPVTFSDPSGLLLCGDLNCNQTATPKPGGGHNVSGKPVNETAPCAPKCKGGSGSGGGTSTSKLESSGEAFLRGLKETTVDIPSHLKAYADSYFAFWRDTWDRYNRGQISLLRLEWEFIKWGWKNGIFSSWAMVKGFKQLWKEISPAFSSRNDPEAWAAAGRIVGMFLVAVATYGAGAAARISLSSLRAAAPVKALCSFTAGTGVLMADGSVKAISQIQAGDVVLATDPETGEQGPRLVTAVWVHDDDIFQLEIDGVVVETTEDHPFWNETDGEWQRADVLDRGDHLLTADGNTATVGGIVRKLDQRMPAYNLTVADLHAYYVVAGNTSVLVHNCPDDVPSGSRGVTLGDAISSNHGKQRLAERGFDDVDIALTRASANAYEQAYGGGTAYVAQVGNGYNVIVVGDRGIVTAMKGLTQRQVNNLARNYGWTGYP